jgi:adenosylhomocysteine nucleosidase
MNKTIGIVVALPGEAKALLGRRSWRKANGFLHSRTVFKDETDLVVVQSGMGMDNAFSAAKWLSEKGVAALGCFGVSGGLDPELGVGDLVFADAVFLERDDGVSLVWKKGGCDSDVTFNFQAAKGLTVSWGPIVTVQTPVLNARGKRVLFDRTGAMAVDMETAAVARAASRSGLPFFAVRTICDSADVTIPESIYQCVDQQGRPRFSRLFRLIIRNPLLISHLLRMKRDFTAALAVAPHVRECLSGMHIPPAP